MLTTGARPARHTLATARGTPAKPAFSLYRIGCSYSGEIKMRQGIEMDGSGRSQDCNSASSRNHWIISVSRRLPCMVAIAVLSTLCLIIRAAYAETPSGAWVSSWTASPQAPRGIRPASLSNRTIRQIVHLSIGGSKVRIRLSNEFGAKPVLIGAASIAAAAKEWEIASASYRPVTFGGAKSVIIPPGAPVVSDPVDLQAAPLSDVAVSLWLPAPTDLTTPLAFRPPMHRRRETSRRAPNSRS